MSFYGIALYVMRAAAFAAVVVGLYAMGCLLLHRKFCAGRLVGIAYLAALVQITVMRGGVDWQAVLYENRAFPQLVPLKTTIDEAVQGIWPLIYHTVGNLIWFMPLGFLLRKKRPLQALLSGALLSAGIELMQFVLMTGMTDIDDVILNALGTLGGWLLIKYIKKNGFD